MRSETQARLEFSTKMLVHEFDKIPRGKIEQEIASIAAKLLAGARFDDYIPVLAHRFAREHLRSYPERIVLN